MIDSPEVQAGFTDLWARSGYGKPMAERREQGGWLMRRLDGSYYMRMFPEDWAAGPCGIDLPPGTLPPDGAVAKVHTHPFHRGERLTECPRQEIPGMGSFHVNYKNESSEADDRELRRFRSIPGAQNLIGIIIDHDQIIAYDGSGTPEGEVKLDRCGY